ncbi:hypothetical protein F2Q69_00047706 [Brassica cretica]|uniref:Uncharacterized protein n=1 Tax=Brassica cretica TaxID=69181 RepID=A0A8S9PNN8_BRACR|nr:hypothetical protein F2Q69_00047706 [Brassica cretica]
MSQRQTRTRCLGRKIASLGASLPLGRIRFSARPCDSLAQQPESRSEQAALRRSLSWLGKRNPMAELRPQVPTGPWQPPHQQGRCHIQGECKDPLPEYL